jgi:hypothetical protein
MPHYKDLENKLHFLDSAKYEYLLPVGCISIIDEEASQIRAEQEAAIPIIISQSIIMRQARLWLIKNKLFAQIDATISSLTGIEGDLARTVCEYALSLGRNNALF